MNEPFDKMGEEQASRVAYLVAGYIRQTLTTKEHDELDAWIIADDNNQKLFEELTDPDNIQRGLNVMERLDVDAAREKLKRRIKFSDEKVVTKKRKWLPYSIAATLVLAIGVVLFFMLSKRARTKDPIARKTVTTQPGGNYATLTLANGKTINLFEVKNGLIDSANGNDVLKTAAGQISYESSLNPGNEFHVLTTPTGGQFQVTLPDGTRVWLNSSSSLKYPVVFDGKERAVELSGEGYFEVKHLTPDPSPKGEGNSRVPFVVKVGDMKVEVLGTHFNINAYKDEATINTTLFEGKVKVKTGSYKEFNSELKPGEQARVSTNKIEVVFYTDPSQFAAWKNGEFKFENATIEEIMRQVARWYGAEIVYEGKTDHHFNATIKRTEPIEKLLNFLAETNEVHFRVEGKKVYVRK